MRYASNSLKISSMNWVMYCSHDDIRVKLDQTADTWIGTCFFAKNIMKFLRGLLCLIFEKSGLKTFQKRIMSIFDSMEAVLPIPQGCMKEIN